MNPNLAFWTGALVNLIAIVALVAIGIRNIRRGRLARHRRCMKTAAALAGCFLGIYPLKVLWFGRERLFEWSEQAVLILRIHEAFVFAMIVGGLIALILSRKMHRNRNLLNHLSDAPLASSRALSIHRKAGWTAAIGAGFAFLTAVFVLVGMYERAVNR
ncbi:MAG TPA: DUF420 domain-containing protein [Myxococcota bacterium]